MRILFVGDSLGLPRPHNIMSYNSDDKEMAIAYDETYSSIIERELSQKYNFNPYIEVINRSRRSFTIKDVSKEFADHLFFFEPNIIVMQVGIVDCWFREKLDGKQMVNKEEYEKNLMRIIGLLEKRKHVKLIIVGISPTSSKMNKRYPGINNEISLYNKILKSHVNNKTIYYIDLEKYINPENPYQYLLPDDHHLNKNGNKLLATLLKRLLIELIQKKRENSVRQSQNFQ